ncbi:MAG: response regulator transcription factor [Eubacteriales bacterium]|jgi:DNA-binding response OmpR family regulator|nr:response regulator transcription factor [Clostridiales bacterium]MDO5585931.1 response regulator transcription factor [Clostridia bacterium]MDY4212530.1 response regulator transcription factor [Eubacteriales bacterium]MDY5229903.1 response regulator transcription factor [Eubacteriales bacterium]
MKILIIEDDLSIAELENDYLTMSGFECDIATDGNSGLEKARSGDYALIIVDIMLPGRDGFSICKEIRAESDVPIIFLSAKSDEIDKVRGLGLGADDYMTKPFSPSELVARVKSHIARYEKLTAAANKAKPDVLTIGGLKIDKNAHRVYVDDNEVAMPVKEYELLLFLAENPNIVFNKERLFDRIWGMDAMGDVSTVTVHIQRIRDKIDKNRSGNKFIETVWGAGYRFRV